jgi:hypothetical protein
VYVLISSLITFANRALVPDAKAKFPGKRPRNPAKKSPLMNGYVPQCERCMEYELAKDEQCPYIRMVSCSQPEHPDFKNRLDMENSSEPACQAYYNERMRELRDGWVFV